MNSHDTDFEPAGPSIEELPVTPLGRLAGRFYFLSAGGELLDFAAKDLKDEMNIHSLMVGGEVEGVAVEEWLAIYFPPKRNRDELQSPQDPAEYDFKAVGRWLMEQCARAGFYSPAQEIRSIGVWRGAAGPVLNTGEALVSADGVEPAGQVVDGVPYPAGACREFPRLAALDGAALSIEGDAELRAEMEILREEMRAAWSWRRDIDLDVLLGWIGLAALGAFPEWRAHLWINGMTRCGKTTLSEVVSLLLGPMNDEIRTSSTEASLRQGRNNVARPFVIDESEPDHSGGRLEATIKLFRLMSGLGAYVEKGTSGHVSKAFRVHGAVAMFSIIPLQLEPQDMNRFILIDLDPLSQDGSPAERAARVERIKARARRIGAQLWRHVLSRAVSWDATYSAYKTLVQEVGGDARDGATIGSVLAGYDMLFSQHATPDAAQLESAEYVAKPLVEAASAAASDDSEGLQCLKHLLFSADRLSGDGKPIATLISEARASGGGRGCLFQKRLGLIGLRWVPEGGAGAIGGEACLRIASGALKPLSTIFHGTRWTGGAHVAALKLLDGVDRATRPTKFAGVNIRSIAIPAHYLPEAVEE